VPAVDLELTGRRALVTGGSSGIGLCVARSLAAEGVDVALVARGEEALSRAAQEVANVGGRRVIWAVADTGDDDAVSAMASSVTSQLGGVDILVNAAATPATGAPFTDDDLEREINVKVRGYLRCARAVAPQMTERGWGRIINISGLAARQTGSIVGTVRNVAVVALTKNLADELGSKGVNVTVVHPGMTRTERTPQALEAMAAARGTTVEELEERLESAVAIGRLVTAEEVASVVTFLASPKSVALNGDAIVAGGGARGSIHY
jgi:NAD(P)-dependent dehydrogenase (short-subunit alcohol dehydrogenase family)